MFKQCFENLNPKIKAGLRETQTDLVGFAEEVSKLLGKIEMEVCFDNGVLYRRTFMKFIVVRAPSPYNIILGRPGLKTLRAIPSIIHAMMKFPTLKGVATLVTQTLIIAECIQLEKKQMVKEVSHEEKGEVAVTEEVLVNPSFPGQLVTIGRGLSEAGRDQLKCLLKDNMEVFAWEPADMTGVPRRIIEHVLNVNPSLDPVCQKHRTFSIENSRVVTNEVAELIKAGIVRLAKYPTYISNHVLVKKGDGNWRISIDFKNLNSACPKDYYPLPNIDYKVETVMGFRFGPDRTSGIQYTYALRLTFLSTNNKAEYEALVAGLRIARQINISNIEVKVDSKLVASLINGSYEASKDIMIKYLAKAKEYASRFKIAKAKEYTSRFKSFSIENISRNMNQKADVLSKLALVAFNHLTKEVLVEVLNKLSTKGQEIHTILEKEGANWVTPIRRCLEEGIWPKDRNEARCLRAKIGQYAMEFGILFKKGHLLPMLRCVGPLQANYVIREIHIGSCGMHVGPRDTRSSAETSENPYDFHHGPLAILPVGINILRPLPPARGGAKFIIVTIDNFTKWIEAKPLVKITSKEMNTAVAHPQANGLVERANRSLMEGIKTRLEREKAGWVDELPNVLWAHRTSIKQSNGETPFSLTYGSEAFIPAEICIPTYRTLMIREEYNEEEMRLNLDLLHERKETVVVKEAR
nr:reverse transcriptase domain-containing protein [Tanacetum cinerariifolium]